MVYYFCHRMSLHVCPGKAVWPIFGKESVLLASACSVLIVMTLL